MRSGLRILFLTLITATAGLCQQVNPNANIRWSAAQGCASMNLVFAPANGACIQAGGVAYGFNNNVGSAQGTTDTTLVLNASAAGYPTQGVIVVDSEYENYTGISGNTLTGITRGYSQTTPATHVGGANIASVDLSFTPPGQIPTGGLFAAGPGAQYLSVNCGSVPAPLGGGLPGMLIVNCTPNRFYVDTMGGMHQEQLGAGANYLSPIYVGPDASEAEPNNLRLPIPITNTTYIVQTNGQNQLAQPIGLAAVAGPVISESAPTLAAPILTAEFIGSGACTATYEVTGVDADGGVVPGTTASISGLAATWSSPSSVHIQTPMAAGVVTYNAYRTAVSGCGTLNTGLIGTATSGQFVLFSDFYTAGDSTTAPVTNTSFAKVCTNGEAFCDIAGTGGTPSYTCTTGRRSWVWHNTSATTSPFALVCNGSSWVTAF